MLIIYRAMIHSASSPYCFIC